MTLSTERLIDIPWMTSGNPSLTSLSSRVGAFHFEAVDFDHSAVLSEAADLTAHAILREDWPIYPWRGTRVTCLYIYIVHHLITLSVCVAYSIRDTVIHVRSWNIVMQSWYSTMGCSKALHTESMVSFYLIPHFRDSSVKCQEDQQESCW